MRGRLNIGDPCPRCGQRIGVLNTRVDGEFRVRYLGCHHCGFRPDDNKRNLPRDQAPPRWSR